MRRIRDEQGSVMTLGIGLFVIVVGICSIGADVSSLWVTRHGLDSVADGAALSAAQAVDRKSVYQHGLKNPVVLNQALANKQVTDYVKSAGAKSRYSNFRIRSVKVTGSEVYVELQATADIPFGYLVPVGNNVILAAAQAKLNLK